MLIWIDHLEDIEEEETRRFLEDYLYITSSNTAEVRAVSQFLFAAAGPVGVNLPQTE